MVMSLKSSARGLQTAVGMSEVGYPIIPTLTLAFNHLSNQEKQTGFGSNFFYRKSYTTYGRVFYLRRSVVIYGQKRHFQKFQKNKREIPNKVLTIVCGVIEWVIEMSEDLIEIAKGEFEI